MNLTKEVSNSLSNVVDRDKVLNNKLEAAILALAHQRLQEKHPGIIPVGNEQELIVCQEFIEDYGGAAFVSAHI